ncbi:MAG: hypothetical protein ABI675_24145 [Chitinophagaceae bacterium]
MNFPSVQQLKSFLKQTFLIGLVISLTVYAWLRLIFFEVPFSLSEDGSIIIKTVLFGWFVIIVLKAAWLFMLLVAEKIETLRTKKGTAI